MPERMHGEVEVLILHPLDIGPNEFSFHILLNVGAIGIGETILPKSQGKQPSGLPVSYLPSLRRNHMPISANRAKSMFISIFLVYMVVKL